MPHDFDNLTDLTQTETDALCDYVTELPEFQRGDTIVAEHFGALSRTKFVPEDGVPVLDYDDNNRFLLVPDGGGGMQLMHQYRQRKDLGFEPAATLVLVGGRYYAFPELNDYGAPDLFLSVVKLED